MAAITISDYKRAYEIGQRHATTFDFCDWYTPALLVAYELGRTGKEINFEDVVEAVRAGNLPESGISYNYREQESELGLSVLNVVGEEEVGSSIWFAGREKVTVKGIRLSYKGSDGETLILPFGIEQFDF